MVAREGADDQKSAAVQAEVPHGMDAVRAMLVSFKLEKYATAFEACGCDGSIYSCLGYTGSDVLRILTAVFSCTDRGVT